MPTKMTGKGLQRVTSRVRYVTHPDNPGLSLKYVHTYAYARPFKSWNMCRNIMTTFFLVSSYPINDWKLWLICFNETSIMNCSLINHNNPVLRALPFIQATAEVILHNYSKFPVFERGLWKRPIVFFFLFLFHLWRWCKLNNYIFYYNYTII